MKIMVFIERENKPKIVQAENISEVLKKLKINPETVIISKDNQLITKKTKLKNNDKIKIIPVISAG